MVFDADDPYTVLAHEVYLHHVHGRLRTIVSDADGWLYVMTSNCDNRGECPPEGDVILRIGPARSGQRAARTVAPGDCLVRSAGSNANPGGIETTSPELPGRRPG